MFCTRLQPALIEPSETKRDPIAGVLVVVTVWEVVEAVVVLVVSDVVTVRVVFLCSTTLAVESMNLPSPSKCPSGKAEALCPDPWAGEAKGDS